MQRYTYIANLLLVFVLPSLELAVLANVELPIAQMGLFLVAVLIMGSLWDIWATRHSRNDGTWIWRFSDTHVLGPKLYDVPIEEYLFYPISTTYIVILWESIKHGSTTADLGMLFLLVAIATQSVVVMVVFMLLGGRSRPSSR